MLGVVAPLSGCTLDNKSIGDDGASGGNMDGSGTDGSDTNGNDTGGGKHDSDVTGPLMDSDSESSTDNGTMDGMMDGMMRCTLPPLPDGQEADLVLWSTRINKVPVGGSQQIGFGAQRPGGPLTEIEACTEWSVAPAEMASIDDDGLLTINEDTPPGTVVTVTVDVEDGRAILSHEIEAYVPIDAAIVGTWTETVRLDCPDLTEFDPTVEQRVHELVFFDSGDFFVTWTTFESYVDFWGTFTYDNRNGELSMLADGGNYVPTDSDLEGTATLEGDTLRLVDMFFGSSNEGTVPAACGHVLE